MPPGLPNQLPFPPVPPLTFKGEIDCVMFSGGVSEFVYGYEKRNLGDLGVELGKKVRARANQLNGGNVPLRPAEVRIRATVIGASQYTVQVSGVGHLALRGPAQAGRELARHLADYADRDDVVRVVRDGGGERAAARACPPDTRPEPTRRRC